MSKVYIRDLSQKEIAVLIDECFYIIGKKTDNLEKFHIDTMIAGIYRYQGGMQIDSFKEAFSDFAAGEVEVELNSGAAPIAIGKLIKAWKAKKYGEQPKREPQQPDKWYASEMEWKTFVNRVKVYGLIMPETLWIRYWNYLVTRGKISGAAPVEKWSDYIENNAEAEVREFIYLNYESYLHDNNLFNGKSGKGNLGIGEKLKRTIGV